MSEILQFRPERSIILHEFLHASPSLLSFSLPLDVTTRLHALPRVMHPTVSEHSSSTYKQAVISNQVNITKKKEKRKHVEDCNL